MESNSNSLGLILYNALTYQIYEAVNSRLKVISLDHNNELIRLREQQNKLKKDEQKKIHRQIVHNYWSYVLSDKQYEAIYIGLDTHVPVKVNKNAIYTEFEVFYQSLLKDISYIPENELRQIKMKLRNKCDKYTKSTANTLFGSHNLKRIKYLTRLWLGISHLDEHKLKNNFQDTLNPFCICGCDAENPCQFPLHCPNFLTERNTLLNKITNIESNILYQADATINNKRNFYLAIQSTPTISICKSWMQVSNLS